MVGDVTVMGKSCSLSPSAALAPQDCDLAKLTAQSHIVDAKSLYDVPNKGSAGSRQDRRSAVEMAVECQVS